MAISPPSDLVLDVVRAADPDAVAEARAKLKAGGAASAANGLAEAGRGFDAALERLDTSATRAGLGRARAVDAAMPDEYRQFEASVLQGFVNSMLPQDAEEIYGKGSAGEFWKGMLAEKIAGEMSKNGGIGIAEQLYSQALARAERSGVVNAATDEEDRSRAMRMITDFERRILATGTGEKA